MSIFYLMIWTFSPLFPYLDFTITSTVIAINYYTSASSILYGHRSFSYATSFLWNILPVHIRLASSEQCFKSLLILNCLKLLICNLYLSLIVDCIVLFMRLEVFSLNALQKYLSSLLYLKKLVHWKWNFFSGKQVSELLSQLYLCYFPPKQILSTNRILF